MDQRELPSSEDVSNLCHIIPLRNEMLNRALQKRREYFESLSPSDLKKALDFQEKIDDVLKSSQNTHNRMVLLQQMMKDSVAELKQASLSMTETLSSFQSIRTKKKL